MESSKIKGFVMSGYSEIFEQVINRYLVYSHCLPVVREAKQVIAKKSFMPSFYHY